MTQTYHFLNPSFSIVKSIKPKSNQTTLIMNDEDFQIIADPSKYVTLPVQNEKIWDKYQCTLEWFWTVYDVYLASDKGGMMKTYNEEERKCILQLIAFMFAAHHTTITKELFMQLMSQVEIKEASYYFGSQADSKKTHTMLYSMMLDELLKDDNTTSKDKLISEVLSIPHVRDFIRWSIKSTTSSTRSFAQRLFALATIQGIIFEAPLLLFKWLELQHPSVMPGFKEGNELVWRDEKLNTSFSCMLFEFIEDELSQEEAHQIAREAVAHAKNILTESIPVEKLGMSRELFEQYIEYSADKILSSLHLSELYNEKCPFDWFQQPDIEIAHKPEHKPMELSAINGEGDFNLEVDL